MGRRGGPKEVEVVTVNEGTYLAHLRGQGKLNGKQKKQKEQLEGKALAADRIQYLYEWTRRMEEDAAVVRCGKMMRAMCNKKMIRVSRESKQWLCKHCMRITKDAGDVRVRSHGKRQKHVSKQCQHCKQLRRYLFTQ